jgi:hypothetical protein
MSAAHAGGDRIAAQAAVLKALRHLGARDPLFPALALADLDLDADGRARAAADAGNELAIELDPSTLPTEARIEDLIDLADRRIADVGHPLVRA